MVAIIIAQGRREFIHIIKKACWTPIVCQAWSTQQWPKEIKSLGDWSWQYRDLNSSFLIPNTWCCYTMDCKFKCLKGPSIRYQLPVLSAFRPTPHFSDSLKVGVVKWWHHINPWNVGRLMHCPFRPVLLSFSPTARCRQAQQPWKSQTKDRITTKEGSWVPESPLGRELTANQEYPFGLSASEQ